MLVYYATKYDESNDILRRLGRARSLSSASSTVLLARERTWLVMGRGGRERGTCDSLVVSADDHVIIRCITWVLYQ